MPDPDPSPRTTPPRHGRSGVTSISVWCRWLPVLVLCAVCLLPRTAAADIYRYVDDNNRVHYVDTPDKVPEQYRNRVETSPESPYQPPETPTPPPAPATNPKPPAPPVAPARQENTKTEPTDALETPFTLLDDQILLEVRLNYRGTMVDTHLMLDTGANMVTLHRPLAERLNIRFPRRASFKGASGRNIQATHARLRYVRVGDVKQEDVRVGIIRFTGNVPYEGLLGMNFITHYNMEIDFDRHVIIWTPR